MALPLPWRARQSNGVAADRRAILSSLHNEMVESTEETME